VGRRRKKKKLPLKNEVAYLTIGPMTPQQGMVLRSVLQKQGVSLGMDLKVYKIVPATVVEEKKTTKKEED